jgi:acyl carrier protein
MENDQLRSRMTGTFRNVFGDPNLVISDGMTAGDVEQWDSLTHINLIVALEREFRIKFTTGEVGKLKNVGELVSLIQRKTS